jgi:cyclohexanone monooxygenase
VLPELVELGADARREREILDAKYREERDKRIRVNGLAQFIAVDEKLSRFADDPYAGEPVPRLGRTELVDVVMVGAGLAGIMAGADFRRAGVQNFRIIDKAPDFGGTWYWNRYPGIRCDCESYIYLPYLEETGYVPTERYASGAEIYAYLRSIAQRYELYENALLQTQVTEVRWSEDDARWVVKTDRGDVLRTRFIVLGSGPLHRPKLPGIPGIEEFEGVQFHSSRWDYGYTGGDATGAMTKLADKRVAVIGTGSSGIQIIPEVARSAAHLFVVQRTPSIVDSRGNAPTDVEWFTAQPDGWQRRRMENFDAILAGMPQEEDLIGDQWTSIWGGRAEAMATGSLDSTMACLTEMDFAQLKRIRARVDGLVADADTAAGLKPYYGRFCKRPTFHDDYLQTFNRPNVTLIDTRGRSLDRITRAGIVFDGKEYPVELIVYASGFEFGVAATRTGGFEVYGPGGESFTDQRADGYRSLHGLQFHGFPNLFVIGGLHHTGLSVNTTLAFDGQVRHVARLVKDFTERGVRVAEVTPEAEKAWGEVIAARSMFNLEASRACTPGAYNNENTFTAATPGVFATVYGGGPIEFTSILERWRAESVEQDMTLEFAPRQS